MYRKEKWKTWVRYQNMLFLPIKYNVKYINFQNGIFVLYFWAKIDKAKRENSYFDFI